MRIEGANSRSIITTVFDESSLLPNKLSLEDSMVINQFSHKTVAFILIFVAIYVTSCLEKPHLALHVSIFYIPMLITQILAVLMMNLEYVRGLLR